MTHEMASFEAVLIEHCAPTMARVKPASLFRYVPRDKAALEQTLAHWRAVLAPRGLMLRIMKRCKKTGSVLLYLYREAWVSRIILEDEARSLLRQAGYQLDDTSLEGLLTQLSERLCVKEEFPHEIGLFLGYPLCDVVGFMRHKGRDYTCCGPWKGYGNAEEAEKRFALLRKCTTIYKRLYENGTPIRQLIVAA